MSQKEIENQIQSEIQEEINLHKIHMHILENLHGYHVSRGFDKIYGDSGSTGEGFFTFGFTKIENDEFHQWITYVDPIYLKYLDKNGYEYNALLEGKNAVYFDNDGNVMFAKADDLLSK